jgi:hypothetical protein
MVTRPRNLAQADPYFDSVVFLAPLSGEDGDTTASDLSNSGHVLTFNGNAQLDGDIRKFGFTSALFDGTGDGITAPDSTDFDLGSGQFTVEADVRFNGDPGTTAMAIVGHYTPTGDERAWSMNLGNTASNQFRFSWSTNGAVGGYAEETAAWDPVGDQWYHLAVARDDTNLYMFIDGVLIKTVANSATFHSATAPLSIGMWSDGNQPLDGWIENVRITKGVCRYTATFTPPERAYPTVQNVDGWTYDGLDLYLDAGNTSSYSGTGSTWFDLTANSLDFTYDAGGTPSWSSADGGGSFDFAGGTPANDVFDIVNDPLLEPGETWSICWWSKHATGSSSTQQYMYSHLTNRLAIIAGYQTGAVNAFVNAGYPISAASQQMSFTENEWTFFCYTKGPNADSNNWKGYKNGVEQFSATSSFTVIDQNGTTHIGNTGTNVAQFQGRVAVVAFYNRALTANEVSNNFDTYKSRFGL